MQSIKPFIFTFLLTTTIYMLFPCPLCLSLPKNANKPFFIEENNDYIDESINFLALKETEPLSTDPIEAYNNQ